jgi:hypothetical protein
MQQETKNGMISFILVCLILVIGTYVFAWVCSVPGNSHIDPNKTDPDNTSIYLTLDIDGNISGSFVCEVNSSRVISDCKEYYGTPNYSTIDAAVIAAAVSGAGSG